ncbi:MAG TPA: hypothetical protein VNH11_34000 [Pirellulales bacterium]|nr:hypothetical protein [Pirellulales bacterium]HVA51405.1 hypothetical protein [Pirellulales bacterium]
MSITHVHNGPQLPETLRVQLLDFRRRVWSIKTAEALAMAGFGLLIMYLAVFVGDRFADTPAWVRAVMLMAALAVSGIVPLYAYRWIWRRRQLPQLARLLSRKHPDIGDQLLGIIELVEDKDEQVRSRALCEAAIVQVAQQASGHDFRHAVPKPRHRQWSWALAAPAMLALLAAAIAPAAAGNAWLRFLVPWRNTPRYTFAAVAAVPDRMVVPHGEPFTFAVKLAEQSRWRPDEATARYGEQSPIAASLAEGGYRFDVPAQIDGAWLTLRVGDASHRVRVEPTLRPELTMVEARVKLPDYLGRPGAIKKDVRGGTLSVVKDSTVGVIATANRELAGATATSTLARSASEAVDTSLALRVGVDRFSFAAPEMGLSESQQVELRWQDHDGLTGLAPFVLSIEARDDDPPTVACQNLPRLKVVLDSEQLSFVAMAQDDFGVKQVGIEWRGLPDEDRPGRTPAEGERVLSAGGPDRELLEAAGVFCAKALGIEPQAIELRVYVEDYLPGRERVYSPPYTLFVLNAEQHAAWLAEQLDRWHHHSLEVRDRELQLYEANKELRDLPAGELDQPETRKRIERQASAERANGARLSRLVSAGEDLVSQAAKNPDFGVGHLEKWAEMLQILKDISANRMPSVAELLADASAAPAESKPSGEKQSSAPQVGRNRDPGTKPGGEGKKDEPPKPPVPSIVDRESSQQPKDKDDNEESPPPGGGSPKFTLPVTTLAAGKSKGGSCPAAKKVDEAVRQQEDLLAEFAKVADELNRILANLEGSTFLKRLKAASRKELGVAEDLTQRITGDFGVPANRASEQARELLPKIGESQVKLADNVGTIMDDMKAYYERRRMTKFKNVLDEMEKVEVVGRLRQVSDDLPRESGLSIAQCEFWSDTLDRWAEDLVDPASGGT